MPFAVIPLLTALTLVSLLLAAVFAMASRGIGQPRHALVWSFAYALGAIEWLMNVAEGTLFHGGTLYWTIAALPLAGSILLAVAGFRLRSGLPLRAGWFGGVALAVMIATALTAPGGVWRHLGINVALLPLCAAVMLPVAIHALLRRPGRRSNAEWACIATLALFTGFEIAIAILALRIGGAVEGGKRYELYLLVLFTGLPSFYIGSGISALFLLTRDQTEVLNHLARHDGMTGALNRRAFYDDARMRLRELHGGHLVICDIDHFKRINDRWGHGAGDRVIAATVTALREGVSAGDLLGRVGGEEFAILLPDTSAADAADRCEWLRQTVAGITVPDLPDIAVTMSFGVAGYGGGGAASLEAVIHAADEALYAAKAAGRDRVRVAPSPSVRPAIRRSIAD